MAEAKTPEQTEREKKLQALKEKTAELIRKSKERKEK